MVAPLSLFFIPSDRDIAGGMAWGPIHFNAFADNIVSTKIGVSIFPNRFPSGSNFQMKNVVIVATPAAALQGLENHLSIYSEKDQTRLLTHLKLEKYLNPLAGAEQYFHWEGDVLIVPEVHQVRASSVFNGASTTNKVEIFISGFFWPRGNLQLTS